MSFQERDHPMSTSTVSSSTAPASNNISRVAAPTPTTLWIGYGFAVLNAVISGIAIYVNSLGVKLFSDSTLYTTLKNSVVGLAVAIPIIFIASQRAELRRLRPRQWGALLLLALVGGSIPYALFFRGLQMTTAVTSSLANHAQFLIVAVLALFFLRERLGMLVWLALVTLFVGVSLGANYNLLKWNTGALLLVLSSVFFAVGVILAKYLMRSLSTSLVMSAKMTGGSLLLLAYVAATGKLGAVTHLSSIQWQFVVVTGLILLAFTITAFVALRYASATATTAIPVASPLITTLLTVTMAGKGHLTLLDGVGLALMFVAAGAIFAFGVLRERRLLNYAKGGDQTVAKALA